MPNIITAATVAILFNALFGYPMGPVNDLLVRLGITNEPVNLLINKAVAKGVVIFIQTWMWYGYTMVVLISGVLGISPEIFEAAEVDGANRVQTFFYVTIPNIKTILLFTLVTSLIGGLIFQSCSCLADRIMQHLQQAYLFTIRHSVAVICITGQQQRA